MPIYLFIHNTDFWFQQTLGHKCANLFYALKHPKELPYRLKLQFLYPAKNKQLLKKVLQTGGKYVALSEAVADELKRYVADAWVEVIPFAVYEEKIQHTVHNPQRLRICIPGMISATRRDYESVFQMLERHEVDLKDTIELELLGAYNPKEGGTGIQNRVNDLINKGFHIEAYHHWLEMDFYNQQLGKADIILGNMHIQQGRQGKYGKTKETGILFTMIKAAKPGFLPTGYVYESRLQSSIILFDNYETVANQCKIWIKSASSLRLLQQNAQQNAQFYHPKYIYEHLEK